MRKRKRDTPANLSVKLKQLRESLGLSQSEMWKALQLEDKTPYNVISGYELGTKEPNLITLLRYARLANLTVDVLIDDELPLPKKLTRKL